MQNIYDYVKEYGNITFYDKEFNDIDNLVFSSLSYLDFSDTCIDENKNTIAIVGNEYFKKNVYKKINKLEIAHREAYKLFEIIIKKERYKDIVLKDYVYKVSKDIQFSAVTFKITNKLNYICFKGTDEQISGWKEDAELACFFPVPAQEEAIKYANKSIHLFGPDIIIGGHSKGGNLALVAGMYTKGLKNRKIKKIYSNDGPGLRKKEFESKEYKRIKDRYIHIVPEHSLVGVLLRNDKYTVVKASTNTAFCHALSTWLFNEDRLTEGILSKESKSLEKNLLAWLDMHNDEERIKIVETFFNILENLNITVLNDAIKFNEFIRIVRGLFNVDKQSRDLAIDLLKYIFKHRKDELN